MRLKLLFSLLLALLLSPLGVGQVHAARYDLSPSSGSLKVSCISTIDVVLDTQGVDTNAVDMFLNYNPAEIDFIDQNPNMGGIQVKQGSLYSVYAANIVESGQVKVTAFDLLGSFNGRGTLVTLIFQSKPGVTSSSFSFDFTPGSTIDSNVADLSATDVLTAVGNGSYSFTTDPCNPDTQAPQVSQINPSNGSTGVPLTSQVSFSLTDNQAGVDLLTFEVQIGGDSYDSAHPGVVYTGNPLDYDFTISPSTPFPDGQEVTIIVRATDFDGNVMSPRVISYNRPVPPPPPPPEPVCGNNIVEDGEECEPGGTFACSDVCLIDVVACLTVDPVVLELAAAEASESGELTEDQVAAVKNMKELVRVIKGDKETTILGGYRTERVVEVITRSTKSFVEKVGCTGDCVKTVFGENDQRWYVPIVALSFLILILLYIIYRMWKKLREQEKKKGKKR